MAVVWWQVAIPAAALVAGADYRLVLRAAATADPSAFSDGSCTMSVRRRPLVAAIAGGASLERSAAAPLVLDASASRDPDAGSGSQSGLSFEWGCTVAPAGAPPAGCRTSSGDLLVLNSSAVLVEY